MQRALVSLTAASLLALCTASSAAEQPDATVDYTGSSFAVVVGFHGGSGVLHYKGADYRFTANGISIGDVGFSGGGGTGNVFHLNKIEEFPGSYTAFAAGASFVVGAGAVTMRNQNGVVVSIGAVTAGAQVTLAPMGVTITLDAPATRTTGASVK
jgi:hypothetical protein